eukprot:512816-Heterocapsa_arctica.AAC.1
MRAHLAARDVARQGDEEQVRLFYEMFVMSNLLGELPLLCNRGLAVRVDGPRQVVERARREGLRGFGGPRS